MKICLYFLFLIGSCSVLAQQKKFTYDDTLRGSNTHYRNWWDVQHYTLQLFFNPIQKTIQGSNTIQFNTIKKGSQVLQIDLQNPLMIDSIIFHGKPQLYTSLKNAHLIQLSDAPYNSDSITIWYHGHPHEAVKAPWDGGVVWTKDSLGNPWFAVACQIIGASVWYPCKDWQGDEPNKGADMFFSTLSNITIISNGQLKSISKNHNNTNTFHWQVVSPINNYDITFYGGNYTSWKDSIIGKKGILKLTYWTLPYHTKIAKKQFAIVPTMLHCFEEKIGPYPFYEDGYQLIEAPYLGMEHQSAVAYGNGFKNGYLGKDLSQTCIGLMFDFIIVHESAHEWFGNSISVQDIADMWIQEGFTTYAESIFIECLWGKQKAYDYQIGIRKRIFNDRPIIGHYGVQNEGSRDMYPKASNMIQLIRLLINNDDQFFNILQDMNKTFYHQIVTTQQIENFWIEKTGLKKLPQLFNDFLRQPNIKDFDINKYK